MGRIYNNFQELINESQELFSLLQKNGLSGVVKAVWYARQHEIDESHYECDLLSSAAKELDERCVELLDEIEEIRREKSVALDELKEIRYNLEVQKRDSVEIVLKLKDTISDRDNSYQDLAERYEILDGEKAGLINEKKIMRDELSVARQELAVALKDESKAKRERAIFESQAVEAKRHANEYREYVKDLKDYATSLKKYPWQKRVSSSFNSKSGRTFPKRASALFSDL